MGEFVDTENLLSLLPSADVIVVYVLGLVFLIRIIIGVLGKGWYGEKKTSFYLWLSLNKEKYPRFHDLIISSIDGTTQIDHVVVSEFGIFIIETKFLQGWIFGSEKQKYWTQSIFGNNYKFQNPLRQIYRQKKVLARFLDVKEKTINTIVFFNGSSTFKTYTPDNVIEYGLGRYIKSFKSPVFQKEKVNEIAKALGEQKRNSKLKLKDHLNSLEERHSTDYYCPRCGGELKVKLARKGINKGNEFWGCSNFPSCKYTESA